MSKSFEDLTDEEKQLLDILNQVSASELEIASEIMSKKEKYGDIDHTPYNYQRINYHMMMAMMARITVLTILLHPGSVSLDGGISPVGNLPPKSDD